MHTAVSKCKCGSICLPLSLYLNLMIPIFSYGQTFLVEDGTGLS